MIRTRTATSVSALLLAVPLLLTGCGLGGDSKNESSSTTSQASQPSASQTSSDGAAKPSETSDAPSTGGGDSSGKPSKDEVKSGLKGYYAKQNLPDAMADKLATCIVDKGYDKFSAKTLNAMKDGKPLDLDQKDAPEFTSVSTQCAVSSGGGALPSNLPTG